MTCFALDARTSGEHFPGIGRYVSSLVEALVRQLDNSDQLMLLCDPRQRARTDLATPDRATVQVAQLSASPFSLRQQWAVPTVLRRLGAEVYHSSYCSMAYWPGVPTVLTVYDLIPLRFPRYASPRARLLFRWVMAMALRTATRIVAISNATREDVLQCYGVPVGKITVAPLAAGPTFLPRPAEDVASVRKRYGIAGNFLFYLGSNKPHKNLVRLVTAWSQLQPRSEVLVIAGAWDERYPEPRQQVAKLGIEDRVRLLGPVPEEDLPALYSGAKLFVFPSEYEGFGLPVLEAMACGAPVVCSGRSSLPEVAGDAAVYVEPAQTESIAAALQRVLDDGGLREDLRERGLVRASQFSWERTARDTLQVYREIAP